MKKFEKSTFGKITNKENQQKFPTLDFSAGTNFSQKKNALISKLDFVAQRKKNFAMENGLSG